MAEEIEWCVGLPPIIGEVQGEEKGGERIEGVSVWLLENDSLLNLSESGLGIDLEKWWYRDLCLY